MAEAAGSSKIPDSSVYALPYLMVLYLGVGPWDMRQWQWLESKHSDNTDQFSAISFPAGVLRWLNLHDYKILSKEETFVHKYMIATYSNHSALDINCYI